MTNLKKSYVEIFVEILRNSSKGKSSSALRIFKLPEKFSCLSEQPTRNWSKRFGDSRCVVRHTYFYSTRSTTVLNDWRNGWRAAGVRLSGESLAALQHSVSELRLRVHARPRRIKALAGHIETGPGRATIYEGNERTDESLRPVWADDRKSTRTNSSESRDVAIKLMSSLWVWYMQHSGTLNLPVADLASTICTRSIGNDSKTWEKKSTNFNL